MPESTEPVDVEARLADPKSYEETILRIYAKKSLRGSAFGDVGNGVTYVSTARTSMPCRRLMRG
jgi:hypothetical protein